GDEGVAVPLVVEGVEWLEVEPQLAGGPLDVLDLGQAVVEAHHAVTHALGDRCPRRGSAPVGGVAGDLDAVDVFVVAAEAGGGGAHAGPVAVAVAHPHALGGAVPHDLPGLCAGRGVRVGHHRQPGGDLGAHGVRDAAEGLARAELGRGADSNAELDRAGKPGEFGRAHV